MNTKSEVHNFADKEVSFWIERGGSIHLKAISTHGDPVELTAHEAREVGKALMAAVDRLDCIDATDESQIPPSLPEQIAAVEGVIRSYRQSYTDTFGERQGQITDPIAARDIGRLEAALVTLQKVAMET